MNRYIKRPRTTKSWDYDEDEPFRPGIEVADHEPVETGLVWPDGEPIMRTPNPMGFGRDGEW
jgi:hypothetical protein